MFYCLPIGIETEEKKLNQVHPVSESRGGGTMHEWTEEEV